MLLRNVGNITKTYKWVEKQHWMTVRAEVSKYCRVCRPLFIYIPLLTSTIEGFVITM